VSRCRFLEAWHSRDMRFWSIFSLASATLLALTLAAPASAHQPVELGPSDSTPAKGPLLVDGTVSFAVYTDVRRGDRRGFRFRLEEGDRMAVQLLILDEPPSNKVRSSRLPRVTITDPQGRKTRMVINERTEFYEPYGVSSRTMPRSTHDNARLGRDGPGFRSGDLGRIPDHLRQLVIHVLRRGGSQLDELLAR
jgi:hypothetical protein